MDIFCSIYFYIAVFGIIVGILFLKPDGLMSLWERFPPEKRRFDSFEAWKSSIRPHGFLLIILGIILLFLQLK